MYVFVVFVSVMCLCLFVFLLFDDCFLMVFVGGACVLFCV